MMDSFVFSYRNAVLRLLACLFATSLFGSGQLTLAQEPVQETEESAETVETSKPEKGKSSPFKYKVGEDNDKLKRLTPENAVWFDPSQKIVIADAEVVLNRGPLEMFACPPHTKEHESVLRVNSPAFVIHAGLLAVGGKSGHPVEFVPEYKAAEGMVIDLYVVWEDEGKQRWNRAQEWVKNSKTGKAMSIDWVFAGSGYWTNPNTNTRHYLAESGELICVSNFSTATLDLPIESSQANAGLLFEANTKAIPAKGTKVKLVLAPRVKKDGEKKNSADEKADDSGAAQKPEETPADDKTEAKDSEGVTTSGDDK